MKRFLVLACLAGIAISCAPHALAQAGPEGAHSEWQVWTGGGHGLNGYKGPMWAAWQSKSLEWLVAQKIIPAGNRGGPAKVIEMR